MDQQDNEREVVVALADESMGGGERRLGLALLANFLRILGDREPVNVHAIVLYNEGVKLLLNESPALAHLKVLEGRGVPLIACRTCMEYLDLEGKLAAGRLGGMAEIQDLMLRYPVVKP